MRTLESLLAVIAMGQSVTFQANGQPRLVTTEEELREVYADEEERLAQEAEAKARATPLTVDLLQQAINGPANGGRLPPAQEEAFLTGRPLAFPSGAEPTFDESRRPEMLSHVRTATFPDPPDDSGAPAKDTAAEAGGQAEGTDARVAEAKSDEAIEVAAQPFLPPALGVGSPFANVRAAREAEASAKADAEKQGAGIIDPADPDGDGMHEFRNADGARRSAGWTELPANFPGREHLVKAGHNWLEQVRNLDADALIALPGIGDATAAKIEAALKSG